MTAPSAQARLTLQDAFERFAATVSHDDQQLFHNTKIKDVRDEAIRIERQLRARRMQKNMARLEPFLRGMEHYSKVVEVLCNGTPYLSWIWAPVKLMLMITVDSISALEKLIEAYGKIADMLPRLDRLSNALVDDNNFQNVLALVYSDILEFHRRAYKFVRRKSWTIFFGSMWDGFESRFSRILENLAYHTELVDKEAAAADISEAIRHNKADEEKWKEQEREWSATKVQRVLAWLGTTDELPADILERHIRDYFPGSCDWFIQHKTTQTWLGDSARNSLLWLRGKPGAGKTMICSTLVQHAEAEHLHVFYYFCNFLGSLSDGPNRLLRSIISQVVQHHQDLAIYIHDVYFKAHPVPTRKALMCLLPELFRGLGSVRLIIDGLDEWDTKDQREIVKDLSQMISTDQSAYICKVMIASRETMDISRSLRKDKSATTISLGDKEEGLAVTRSITDLVYNKLSNLPGHVDELDPETSILSHIRDTLLKKSQGMFLWVVLVLNSLNVVYSPEELRAIVDDLPSDLEALYEQILIRLCSVQGAQSYGGVPRIMSWICFARRPLHKSELLQALSIMPSDQISHIRSIPVASILDHCKPFIEELPDSTIVPVHFSVTEFFIKSQKLHTIPAIDATLDVASACAIIITRALDLILSAQNYRSNLAKIVLGNYRLLPYAIEYWIEHCLRYATLGVKVDLNAPIHDHLAGLYEKHKRCSQALGQATMQAQSHDTNNASQGDKRLELFSNVPIYALMTQVSSLKQLASQLDGEDSSDIETYIANNDQTLFSKLARVYENAVVHLLAQQQVDGISVATLRIFQESYASTAFCCRFPQCDRLSLGFATAELRLEHERVHVQRVYCQTISCQYSRIGFGKRSALKAHTRKHHSQPHTLLIPAQVRRTIRTKTPAEGDTFHTQNAGTAAQQPMPVRSPLDRKEVSLINQFAKQLMDSAKDDIRQRFESEVAAWPEDGKQQLISQGISPLYFRFRQHAEMLYRRGALGASRAGQFSDLPNQTESTKLELTPPGLKSPPDSSRSTRLAQETQMPAQTRQAERSSVASTDKLDVRPQPEVVTPTQSMSPVRSENSWRSTIAKRPGLQHFARHYRQQLLQGKVSSGWQQAISPDERGTLALQLYTQYRMLKPDTSEIDTVRNAIRMEMQSILAAQNKDQYITKLKQTLMMMTQARQQHMQARHGGSVTATNYQSSIDGSLDQELVPNPHGHTSPGSFPRGTSQQPTTFAVDHAYNEFEQTPQGHSTTMSAKTAGAQLSDVQGSSEAREISGTSVHSAVPHTASVRDATEEKQPLSDHSRTKIRLGILGPLMADKDLTSFRALVLDMPRCIAKKSICNLRDLEKTMIFSAPVFSTTHTMYLNFCLRFVQLLRSTVEDLSEEDLRLPGDRPYSDEYFLDLTEQIRRHAAVMAATQEGESEHESVDGTNLSHNERITSLGDPNVSVMQHAQVGQQIENLTSSSGNVTTQAAYYGSDSKNNSPGYIDYSRPASRTRLGQEHDDLQYGEGKAFNDYDRYRRSPFAMADDFAAWLFNDGPLPPPKTSAQSYENLGPITNGVSEELDVATSQKSNLIDGRLYASDSPGQTPFQMTDDFTAWLFNDGAPPPLNLSAKSQGHFSPAGKGAHEDPSSAKPQKSNGEVHGETKVAEPKKSTLVELLHDNVDGQTTRSEAELNEPLGHGNSPEEFARIFTPNALPPDDYSHASQQRGHLSPLQQAYRKYDDSTGIGHPTLRSAAEYDATTATSNAFPNHNQSTSASNQGRESSVPAEWEWLTMSL